MQSNQIDDFNNSNNNGDKTNFLSLIRMLLNHGVKNDKKGITILSDMGSFFHYGNSHQYNSNQYNVNAYDRISISNDKAKGDCKIAMGQRSKDWNLPQ